MPVIVALLVAALLGGGTSYAAQGALPGDTLYPVKTHVNEPVQEALAFSTQAKADVEANIAEERLSEAEKLAQRGTLSTTTAAQLAADFANHLQKSETNAHQLAGKDPASAAETDSSLAARIAAHKDILEALSSENEDAPAINGIVASLTAHLAQHGEEGIASTTAAQLPDQAFASLQDRAQSRFADAQDAVKEALAKASSAATSSVTAVFAQDAQAALTNAKTQLDSAIAALTAGKKADAYTAFVASMNASAQAKAYANATERMNKGEEHAARKGESDEEHGNATSTAAREREQEHEHGNATSSEMRSREQEREHASSSDMMQEQHGEQDGAQEHGD